MRVTMPKTVAVLHWWRQASLSFRVSVLESHVLAFPPELPSAKLAPNAVHVTSISKNYFRPSSLLSSSASSSSTLRFYATNRYLPIQFAHYQVFGPSLLHMRNSEYSSNHLRPRPPGWVTGLPVRVRRHSTSAIGIRKAGQVSILHIEPSGERKGESACSYGRAVAKTVCALRSMTLKCNTQRASFSFTSVSGR